MSLINQMLAVPFKDHQLISFKMTVYNGLIFFFSFSELAQSMFSL